MEGSEGKEEERKKEREKGREGAREKGRVRIGKKASEGERALLASVVHVARALYMNVTQDVAVGLSCILCTTPTDYPEYHAPLRLILLYPVYDSDRFARIFIKIANKFAYSKNSSYLCSRICVRALLRARIFFNVLL